MRDWPAIIAAGWPGEQRIDHKDDPHRPKTGKQIDLGTHVITWLDSAPTPKLADILAKADALQAQIDALPEA